MDQEASGGPFQPQPFRVPTPTDASVSILLSTGQTQLTWNYLKHPVLFHVGWQVARSHLVVLNFDGSELLQRKEGKQ